MGLSIFCKNISFYCSYSGYNKLRLDLIKASIKYLNEEISLLKDKVDDEVDDVYIESIEGQKYYMNISLKYLESLISNNKILFNKINLEKNNSLKHIGLYGIISLVCHSDCDGELTIGEAVDFIDTLEKIYPYCDSYYFEGEEIELENYDLYKVFKHSIETKKIIMFS